MYIFDQPVQLTNHSNDLLTIGEILVDMIANDYDDSHTNNRLTYEAFFGGSPSNIAMNTTRLGIRSKVAAAVGDDRLGQFLQDHLVRANIDTTLIQTHEAATSMVVLSKSKGSPIPIFYRGADAHLAYTEQFAEAVKHTKIIHFSCWPLSASPVRETIEAVIAQATQSNSLICFDPNYHPSIWQYDENAFEYIKTIIAKVDIVKPSEDDAARLFGDDLPEAQVKKFLDLGAKLVIMTLGKDGAIVSNGTETMTFASVAEEVVDTTGAGDAFWSGFYTGIVEGLPLKLALQLGFSVSAYKLKFVGAVVDLPHYTTLLNGNVK
ncbi:carbohydrate kinase family protein [Paenibacillus endoradicis]|uniref:carbohydrate kinase family protein n=1 Tax=Paenibacillus endoradicis TaxID=2972487 RepID=UPI002159A19C|nr:carbohydrate kinase [Paenibacillus endoradicis]MCR8660192.1 carbohydrate kinase [Paenibacillus endoradicis]